MLEFSFSDAVSDNKIKQLDRATTQCQRFFVKEITNPRENTYASFDLFGNLVNLALPTNI